MQSEKNHIIFYLIEILHLQGLVLCENVFDYVGIQIRKIYGIAILFLGNFYTLNHKLYSDHAKSQNAPASWFNE